MKRYIRSYTDTLISNIAWIDVVDDFDFFTDGFIFASDTIDDDLDAYYMTWTDEQLESLSTSEVESIKNINVLVRLNGICPDKLSKSQRDQLFKAMSTRQPITKIQVDNVVESIKQCNNIHYTGNHRYRRKNLNFILDNALSDADLLEIVHQIKSSDISEKYRSIDPDTSGDMLLVFGLEQVELSDGRTFQNLEIYIKLDITNTSQSAAVLAIHPAEYSVHHLDLL